MKQTKTKAVADQIRDQILVGRYKEGDRMPSERELVDRLGIHRGAIREGLRSVEQLGLIEIKAGGARVLPLQNASLDVVDSMLALENPPNTHLVGQLLEMHAGLFSMAVRLSVEKAPDAIIAEARSTLSQFKGARSGEAYIKLVQSLVRITFGGCDNIVLQLTRNSVKDRFWATLLDLGITVRPPLKVLSLFVRNFDHALRDRQAAHASELLYNLLITQKAKTLEQLEQIRAAQNKT